MKTRFVRKKRVIIKVTDIFSVSLFKTAFLLYRLFYIDQIVYDSYVYLNFRIYLHLRNILIVIPTGIFLLFTLKKKNHMQNVAFIFKEIFLFMFFTFFIPR